MTLTKIKLSKSKLLVLLASSALLVFLSFCIFINANEPYGKCSPTLVKAAGIISIVLFAIAFLYTLVKLFDNKPGLIIDEKGITDNTSGVSAGFIAWNEITEIKMEKIQFNKFLLIHTTNNEKYIMGKNKFQAILMRMNAKMYGTPLSISATALQCNFKDLETLILKSWETYRG